MSVWGQNETLLFNDLQPEPLLESVEQHLKVRCTGRIQALNSLENRVYDIELEEAYEDSDRIIAKFYRPGRWSFDQIQAEHDFLHELSSQDLNVVAPIQNVGGQSIYHHPTLHLFMAVFPKFAGRIPDELSTEQLEQLGRTIGRMHLVGEQKKNASRMQLNVENFGRGNLKYLVDNKLIHPDFSEYYQQIAQSIFAVMEPLFSQAPAFRIHGDLHRGNILWGRQGFTLVDFDDMVIGPAIQDLWLVLPEKGHRNNPSLDALLKGYQSMRQFDARELQLVEGLRALRYIHFSAWIARRWKDPTFQKMFPDFGSQKYWQEQYVDLREQLSAIQEFEA